VKSQTIYPFLAWTAIFLIILSPQLFSEGMFMDGVYYATIARNIAEGIGSFWIPALSDTLGVHFYEHPPLGFGMQSVFFSLFGDHFWVERLYSLLTYLITAWLMLRFWKLIAAKELEAYGLVSLFLWITVPKIIWGASANLLENTSMIFILLSIYYQLQGFIKQKSGYLLLGGLFIFLAFLTKGITALFPLSFPFFYRLSRREFKMVFKDYALLLGSMLISFSILILLQPVSLESLQHYFQIQVLGSLQNPAKQVGRFYIINRSLQEVTVILILLVLVMVLYRRKVKEAAKLTLSPYFWPILLCALSGILPIMLSLKQSTFYIIPTFSLISLALTLLIAPRLKRLLHKLEERGSFAKIWKYAALVGVPIAILSNGYFFGKLNRDKTKLTDIKQIIELVTERTVIQIHPSMKEQYAYYAYFYRYGKISLSTEEGEYYLSPIELPVNSKRLSQMSQLDLKSLILYDKRDQ
jgi:4-amino-4-deoxy-L-arabinose transferase-like glycosyltransferase